MNWKTTAYFSLFALIFLDSFFFNIAVGPLRMTLLRSGDYRTICLHGHQSAAWHG